MNQNKIYQKHQLHQKEKTKKELVLKEEGDFTHG